MPRFLILLVLLGSLCTTQQMMGAEGYPDEFYQSDRPPMLGIGMGRRGPDGGVTIHNVFSGTAAENMGLQRGDVITSLNGRDIGGPRELWRAVRSHNPGDEVKVTVTRDGQEHEFHSQFREWPKHIPGANNNWGNRSPKRENRDSKKRINKKELTPGKTVHGERPVKKKDDRSLLNKLADAIKKKKSKQNNAGHKDGEQEKTYDGSPISTGLRQDPIASPLMHVAAAIEAMGKAGWEFDFHLHVDDAELSKSKKAKAPTKRGRLSGEMPECDVSCYWSPTAVEL